MEQLKEAILTYVDQQHYLPTENLSHIRHYLKEVGQLYKSDDELGQALTELVHESKLCITVRKGEFLQLQMTAAYAGF